MCVCDRPTDRPKKDRDRKDRRRQNVCGRSGEGGSSNISAALNIYGTRSHGVRKLNYLLLARENITTGDKTYRHKLNSLVDHGPLLKS